MNTTRIFILLTALTAAAACSKENVSADKGGSITISVSPTAARSAEKSDFETRISSMGCLLFKDDVLLMRNNLDGVLTSSFEGLSSGSYRVVILTGNPPQTPLGISYNQLLTGQYYMFSSSNGYSTGFPMFGTRTINLGESQKINVTLSLAHCCAKLEIKSLNVDYSGILTQMGVEDIDLEEVFIMNARSACHVDGTAVQAREWGSSGVNSFNYWDSSHMVMHPVAAQLSATYFAYSGEFIPLYIMPTAGSTAPYSTYLILNTTATLSDSSSLTWYYRIRLDDSGTPVCANGLYEFYLTITGPGADSPDKDVPGNISCLVWEAGQAQQDTF